MKSEGCSSPTLLILGRKVSEYLELSVAILDLRIGWLGFLGWIKKEVGNSRNYWNFAIKLKKDAV